MTSTESQKWLSGEDRHAIELKIAAAESLTTAEIKVVIAKHAWSGMKRKAHTLFRNLNLHKTTHRNAVMILVVPSQREFLIYGDEAIHAKVTDAFWRETRDIMEASFKQGLFFEALSTGIHRIGTKLAEYFPQTENDKNEIVNHVVFTS